WIRMLNETSARSIDGTAGAAYPFWSPDGRSVGFFADMQLKRVDIAEGLVRVLAPAGFGSGGAWNRDGVILFAPSATQDLYRIRDIGGDRSAVTSLRAPQEIGHLHPVFLADGRHFLFTIRGVPDVQGVYVGSLDSGEAHRLLPGAVAANLLADYL